MGWFRFVFELLAKVALGVAVVLLLQGAVAREQLFLLLGLAVMARGFFLWREWRKPREGDPRRLKLEREFAAEWCLGIRKDEAGGPGEEAMPSEAEVERALTRPALRQAFARFSARRSDADIATEAASLLATAPGAFLLALMSTSPVATWTGFDRGPALLAIAAGTALHFSANLIPMNRAARRVLVRLVLMTAVVGAGVATAKARHPYLLASGATHRRMIAERVWNLGLTVEAGRYAGVLLAYGRDLEAARRWEDAKIVYERALALDAFRTDGHEGLARVLDALGQTDAADESRLAARRVEQGTTARDGDAEAIEKDAALPVFDWSPARRLRICLVPAGDVPEALLDAAGSRMGRVLEAEVFRWPGALPLPAPDRRAGLLGGDQWRPEGLFGRFQERLMAEAAEGRHVSGAWQFILVTSGDLFLPDANFVFAASFPVHGVVSCARFGDPTDARCAERVAKQLVSTAIKCFGAGQARQADCVTAYVRSLHEHDRKPSRPAAPTRAEYRRRVELWEGDPSRPPEPPRQ